MVICKTPFRISFLGGGTDFPAWYNREGKSGIVISTTIDKYSYIICRKISSFFTQHKLTYHEIEYVDKISKIKHPSIREVFKFLEIKEPLSINYDADLIARSGIGSSSAFTVGLLHALYTLKKSIPSKEILYEDAIYIEQELIKENVGSQDQVAVSVGGLNEIHFNKGKIYVKSLEGNSDFIRSIDEDYMMFFTGQVRIAASIEADKISKIDDREIYYNDLFDLTKEFIDCGYPSDMMPMYLHKAWNLKKCFSPKVSSNILDDIYDLAMKNGAEGGKLLGSGGGGFYLFFVRGKKNKNRLKEALKKLKKVDFKHENFGSHILFSNGDKIE